MIDLEFKKPSGKPWRVLLIYPPIGEITNYNTPVGLLYIGTILKKRGNEVKLIDCSVEPDYNNILEKEIKDSDMVGVYLMSPMIKYALPVLKKIKRMKKNIKIICGGPHATLFPKQTAESKLIDVVVKDEGEGTILELIDSFESGNIDLHKVKGISFEENGKVFSTPPRDFINLNTLPPVDWSLVNEKVMHVISKRIIRVQTSRGCPFKCTFCINRLTNNNFMRYRDAELVLDEIEGLYKKYHIKEIGFRDELFLSNVEQVRKIAQGIIDRNIKIKWFCGVRVNYLSENWASDDLLKLMVKSGCYKLQAGAESGSNEILRFLKKGITKEMIINFVKRCKKFNLNVGLSFMIGLPKETKEQEMETIKLIRTLVHINPRINILGPGLYRPYPGGELYDLCVKEYGIKLPSTLEEWQKIEYIGGEKTPWVKDFITKKFMWTSMLVATITPGMIFRHLFRKPIEAIAIVLFYIPFRLRLELCFYKFPIDFYILHVVYKYILKREPLLS